jgi:MarR family transcriptional regulator, transcriptional regulator for hemolysin
LPSRHDDEPFGFLITDSARLLRAEFDRLVAAENIGVTPGEARTLVHVARAAPVRQSVLAEQMGVEAMTLSTFLDRLEERGLVLREPDPSDRRAKLVKATPAAAALLPRIRKVGEMVRREAEEGIDPADWANFLATLKRLRVNLCERRQDASRTRPAA